MRLQRLIRPTFLIMIFTAMLFVFIRPSNATADTDLISTITWKSTPFWSNATTLTFPSVSSPYYVLPALTSHALTDLRYLTSDIYAWKYTYQAEFLYGGYNSIYNAFYLNGTDFPGVGLWDYSDSNTYTTVRASAYYSSLGPSITLSYATYYDFEQITVWNNTLNYVTTQLRVFALGTSTQIGSSSVSGYSTSSFNNSATYRWVGGGGNEMVIKNENAYQGSSITPISGGGGGGGFLFLDIPAHLALATGLSLLSAGLVCGFMLELACVLPVLIFTDNTLVITIFAVIGLCLGVAFQWMPYVTLILIILIIALMYANKIRGFITGGDSEK